MVTRCVIDMISLVFSRVAYIHTYIHTFIEAPFTELYRAIFYARCILVGDLQKGNRRIVNPSTL